MKLLGSIDHSYGYLLLALACWIVFLQKLPAQLQGKSPRSYEAFLGGLVCIAVGLTLYTTPVALLVEAKLGLPNIAWYIAYCLCAFSITWTAQYHESKYEGLPHWLLSGRFFLLLIGINSYLYWVHMRHEAPSLNRDLPASTAQAIFIIGTHVYGVYVFLNLINSWMRLWSDDEPLTIRLKAAIIVCNLWLALIIWFAKIVYALLYIFIPGSSLATIVLEYVPILLLLLTITIIMLMIRQSNLFIVQRWVEYCNALFILVELLWLVRALQKEIPPLAPQSLLSLGCLRRPQFYVRYQVMYLYDCRRLLATHPAAPIWTQALGELPYHDTEYDTCLTHCRQMSRNLLRHRLRQQLLAKIGIT